MDVQIYINGVLRTDLRVLQLKRSYLEPWTALLRYSGRHDACGMPRMWDSVLICRVAESGGTTTTTSGGYPGPVLFRGNITEISPGGVAEESWSCTASGKRFRLENEPVRINGRGHYVWNRRGHRCDSGSGEDSPGADGGKWTAGEIAVDILEHALGIPAGGSDISGHHGDPCCVTDTYLTADDIAGYTAADWLALDTVIGEFSVDNTPVAQALDMLLGLAGGFYGWYIDPETGNLVLTDLDACPVRNIEAGQLGHWQDEAGKNYVLLDNKLDWSLDGVCTTVIVQGTDRTVEEKPANIEGTGNPALGDAGELELVAAPWMDWPAAFRHVCQTKRLPTWREIDPDNTLTPPQGYLTWDKGPRIYRGTDAGPKQIYVPSTPGALLPSWNRVTGIISFYENPVLEEGEKLWAWYFARVPFTVQAGPDGDAYWHYGYENTLIIYDPAFKHPTSWPQAGTADDEVAMGILAERILRQRKDVRRQGVLVCDEVDPSAFGLDVRYNVLNLGCTSTPAPEPTTSTLPPDPMQWDKLSINAVEVIYDFDRNETQITVANTFFMLEGYSELKRRLEQNLFARREFDLSEDINSCQTIQASWRSGGGESPAMTTTAAPPPTTTAAPPPTTTPAPPSTTTAAPPPTTLPPGPTTAAPSTTTSAPSTTTVAPSTTTVAPSTTTVTPSTTTLPPPPTTTPAPPPTTTATPPPTTLPPGPTTTTSPGTTTSAPSTTTLPPTTTTTAAPGCPTDEHCQTGCPSTVYLYVDSVPNCPELQGMWVWDRAFDCTWGWTSGPAMSDDITCTGGVWHFTLSGGMGSCGASKTAYTDSCPTGTYSVSSVGACQCPSEFSVYS